MKKSLSVVLMCGVVAATVIGAVPSYKVEKSIGKKSLGYIPYIALDSKDNLLVLQQNGQVKVFDSKTGELTRTVKTQMGKTTALAVDKKDNIYLFVTDTKMTDYKYKNRTYKRAVPIGVTCGVYDPTGKELRKMKLTGVKSAKAARVIKKRILVADYSQKKIITCNTKTGKRSGRIGAGIRLCCGIFDFDVNHKQDQVLISNLGAFKADIYSIWGMQKFNFGKRGRGLDQFHGCCNPVNAVFMPNGCIVTAEKDPTRIKIYDAKGKNAKLISGVGELVKGCSHVPIVVDSKGNIYLAANKRSGRKFESFIVKCIPQIKAKK